MGLSKSTSVTCCLLLCLAFLTVDSVRARRQDRALSSIEDVIDATLVVPSGNEVQQLFLGVGFQIYEYNGTDWVNVNVSADLYNFKGVKVGHHFFLPEVDSNGGQATWETFRPATRVTCKKASSVQKEEDSIAWLLLEATDNSGSLKYVGSTTFVQRLYTQHGNAPSADVPTKTGDIFTSSYTAVYTFSSNQASRHSR